MNLPDGSPSGPKTKVTRIKKLIKKTVKVATGRTIGGDLSWKEFMALPPGKPAPPADQHVRLLVYPEGTIRKAGNKITVIFRDSRKNKKCGSMKAAFDLVTKTKVKSIRKKKTKKRARQSRSTLPRRLMDRFDC